MLLCGDKYGVRFRGDAGVLVNARKVCDLQPRLTRIDRKLPQTTCAIVPGRSGDLLPPSPPAEKATARQDQAGKSCKPRLWSPAGWSADRRGPDGFGTEEEFGSPYARKGNPRPSGAGYILEAKSR